MTQTEPPALSRRLPPEAEPELSSAQHPRPARTRRPRGRFERGVALLFGVLQGLLILDVMLRALAARETQPLVAAVLASASFLAAPVHGMLHPASLGHGAVLDLPACLALVGWTAAEIVVLWLLGVARPRAAGGVASS